MSADGREAAATAAHRPLDDVAPRLDAKPWVAVRAAVTAARKAHRQALEEEGLAGSCPPDSGEARAKLQRYLLRVADGAHEPLTDALEEHLPLASTLRALDTALTEAREAARALPARSTVSVGADPLRPVPGEGLGRALKKAVARVAWSVRPLPAERDVPLMAVTTAHVANRVEPRVVAWSLEAGRRAAGWLNRLESAWARWTETGLETLMDPELSPGRRQLDAAEVGAAWAAIAAAGSDLDAALRALEAESPLDGLASDVADGLAELDASLQADLGVAGTFVLRGVPPAPAEAEPPRAVREWMAWEAQVLARFTLHASLLGALETAASISHRIPGRLRADALTPWAPVARDAADTLDAASKTVAEAADLAPALETARTVAEQALADVQVTRPVVTSLEEAAQRAADSAVASLQSFLRATPPELILHPLAEEGEPLLRPVAPSPPLRLQELARQAFDALRIERIRTTPGELVGAATAVAATLDEVSEVVAFGFDAAARELEEGDDEAVGRSRALAAEGLSRAAELLRSAEAPVDEAVDRVRRRLGEELLRGSERLVERALARRVQARLLDARSRLSRRMAAFQGAMMPRMARLGRHARRGWRELSRGATGLLRRGRSFVGVSSGAPGTAARTARSLAAADELIAGLPLVYQRLFSDDPVAEEALLVGREAELADAEARWRRWHDEDGVPLVVTGASGAGLSSFVRVFVARLGGYGAHTVHDVLDHRITSEAELSGHLAQLLDLPEASSLDELVGRILRAPRSAVPDLVALEGLEHLYLREPGGTDLLERLLTAMAETEPRTFWLGTMNRSAWQLVEKSEPTAVAQVERIELTPLGPAAIRAAVLARHRRSGVPLHYLAPEGRRFLRRRLNRAGEEDARIEILEADYFDRLHRSSFGSVRLALFQWLRSADFENREGELTVRPLEPLDFSFLDALDLTQNFSAKAFLEHRTLTLAEHDRIFRLPRQESYQIFESLENRHIIEPTGGTRTGARAGEMDEGRRYRIRPLLVGALAAHLASRNIVH